METPRKSPKLSVAAITGEVKVLRAGEVNVDELNSYDLLVIGSPTQGGRPMASVMELIDKIPESALKGKNSQRSIPESRIAKLFGFPPVKLKIA